MPNNNRGRGRSRRGRQNYRRRQPIIPRPWRSPDPPSFNPVPWMYLTIEFQYLTLMHDVPGVLTIQDITTAITDRLGITVNDGNWTVVQLFGIAAWETTGAGLTLTLSDLDHPTVSATTDQAALATLYDRAGRNRWAHVSFVWPRDMRNNTFNTSQDDFNIAYITVAPEVASDSTKVHVYLRLRWRTSKAASVPAHLFRHPERDNRVTEYVRQAQVEGGVPNNDLCERQADTAEQGIPKPSQVCNHRPDPGLPSSDGQSWEEIMEEEEMIQQQLENYAKMTIKDNHY